MPAFTNSSDIPFLDNTTVALTLALRGLTTGADHG